MATGATNHILKDILYDFSAILSESLVICKALSITVSCLLKLIKNYRNCVDVDASPGFSSAALNG
jgi:hypothetical protein